MAADLVLRTVKGTPLTNLEVDNNFSRLNTFISNVTTVTNSTTDDFNWSLLMANVITGGEPDGIKTTTSKLYFNPSTGTLHSTDYNSLSDARLKDNINSIDNAVYTVTSLRGVSFEWKDSGRKSYGVIAQEIEEFLPELVKDDGTQKTVNYNGLIGLLINAVKELDARVRELEAGRT